MKSPVHILSCVAARPKGRLKGLLQPGDAFIDAVKSTLNSRGAVDITKTLLSTTTRGRETPPGHAVVETDSVQMMSIQIDRYLERYKRRRVRVQVIGHASSGMISLGARWIGGLGRSVVGSLPYYVLNTHPGAMALLYKHAGAISELMLAGCNVGTAFSYTSAVNGRILLFTLSELLRCQVRGADDIVGPTDFDSEGWYSGSASGRPPVGWVARRNEQTRPPEPLLRGPRPRKSPASGRQLPQFASAVLVSAFRPASQLKLSSRFVGLLPRVYDSMLRPGERQPTSLPEFTLQLQSKNGTSVQGELLCGGQYLRLCDERGDTVYRSQRERVPPAVREEFAALLCQYKRR